MRGLLPLPACGERVGEGVRELRHREAVGELEGGLERFGEPCSNVGANDEPVDHHVDVVVELLVERGR